MHVGGHGSLEITELWHQQKSRDAGLGHRTHLRFISWLCQEILDTENKKRRLSLSQNFSENFHGVNLDTASTPIKQGPCTTHPRFASPVQEVYLLWDVYYLMKRLSWVSYVSKAVGWLMAVTGGKMRGWTQCYQRIAANKDPLIWWQHVLFLHNKSRPLFCYFSAFQLTHSSSCQRTWWNSKTKQMCERNKQGLRREATEVLIAERGLSETSFFLLSCTDTSSVTLRLFWRGEKKVATGRLRSWGITTVSSEVDDRTSSLRVVKNCVCDASSIPARADNWSWGGWAAWFNNNNNKV